MPDNKTTIAEMIREVAKFQTQRDWAQFHSPKNLAMGTAIEAAELMEHFQWISEQQSREVADDPEQLQLVREEISDVLAYLLNLAYVLDIDLSDAFFAKMKRNAEKYPADKYRGRYKA